MELSVASDVIARALLDILHAKHILDDETYYQILRSENGVVNTTTI
jgi:hypothetical protein